MVLTWILPDSVLVISQGFMLCASLIIAVGPQNLFVLKQGLSGHHLFATALICTLADLFLISIGVGGLGTIISANAQLLLVATLGGAALLLGYGICSFRSALRYQSATSRTLASALPMSLRGTILTTLSFSLLNPTAYIDTILMVGATSSQYPVDERFVFGAGAVMASGFWFFTLTYGSSRFAPLFSHPVAWRMLDIVSGCIMVGLAISICAVQHFWF